MYIHKVSTATLGGHGIGAKTALMASCFKPENVTGFFGLNYSPLNYNYFDFAHTLKSIIQELSEIDMHRSSRK